MRLEGVFTASGVNCRMGQPAKQVLAFSGKLPSESERNKAMNPSGGAIIIGVLVVASPGMQLEF